MFDFFEALGWKLVVIFICLIAVFGYTLSRVYLNWIKTEYYSLKRDIVRRLLLTEQRAIDKNNGIITSEFIHELKQGELYTYLRGKLSDVRLMYDDIRIGSGIDIVKQIRSLHKEISRTTIAIKASETYGR